MSFASSRRRAVVACLTAIVVIAASGAPAFADDAAPVGCPPLPTVQPFSPWLDVADYFLAPGGDVEAAEAGWDLTGGAAAVERSDGSAVGGAGDHLALNMPAGSSATTARFCVGLEHRSMRFFVRGPASGVVHVDAVYAKHTDKEKNVRLASVAAGESWAPSPVVPMIVNELAAASGNALQVSLRFSARGAGSWQIDDVYVDPFKDW